MSYRENVQAACDELGIQNPIQENNLCVAKLVFYQNGDPKSITATNMNRAGRLFFQMNVDHGEFERTTHVEMEQLAALQEQAAEFFAENWQDAKKVGRPMLVALMHADGLTIYWK